MLISNGSILKTYSPKVITTMKNLGFIGSLTPSLQHLLTTWVVSNLPMKYLKLLSKSWRVIRLTKNSGTTTTAAIAVGVWMMSWVFTSRITSGETSSMELATSTSIWTKMTPSIRLKVPLMTSFMLLIPTWDIMMTTTTEWQRNAVEAPWRLTLSLETPCPMSVLNHSIRWSWETVMRTHAEASVEWFHSPT